MMVLAAGARHIHQQLLAAQQQPFDSVGVHAWLPEYATITVFLTCMHSFMCLECNQGSGTSPSRGWGMQLSQPTRPLCDSNEDEEGLMASAAAGDAAISSRRRSESPAQSRRPTSSARSSFSQPAPVYARLQVDVGLVSSCARQLRCLTQAVLGQGVHMFRSCSWHAWFGLPVALSVHMSLCCQVFACLLTPWSSLSNAQRAWPWVGGSDRRIHLVGMLCYVSAACTGVPSSQACTHDDTSTIQPAGCCISQSKQNCPSKSMTNLALPCCTQGAADEEGPAPPGAAAVAPAVAGRAHGTPLKRASFLGPMDAYSHALLVPALHAAAAKEPVVDISSTAVCDSGAATDSEPATTAGRVAGVAEVTPPPSPRRGQRRSILWADTALLALQEEQPAPDADANTSNSSRQSSRGSQPSKESAVNIRPKEVMSEQPTDTPPSSLASTAQPTASRPAGASRLGPRIVLPASQASQDAPELSSCTTPRGAPSRSLSRARSLQRQLSMQNRTSCAGAAGPEEDSASQGHQQQVAYDALLLLFALVGSCAAGGRLLPVAWRIAAAGAVLPASLATACALIHMFASLPFLVYLWRYPAAFSARRELIWPCRFSVGLLSHEFACLLLGLTAFRSAGGGLAFKASLLGLAHASVPTFARWWVFGSSGVHHTNTT
jgi:hypothetical protein